jgi:hypothetical protein
MTGADVNAAVPVTPLTVAEMVAVPDVPVTADANPDPVTDTTDGADELQDALWVTSCCALFTRMPVATRRWPVPGADDATAGDTNTDARGDTVTTVDPLMLPEAALITEDPVPDDAVTSPSAFTDAMSGSEELHVTPVRARDELFEKTP